MTKKQRESGKTGGDRIEISIGDSARNVAAGKDIHQVTGVEFANWEVIVAGRDVAGRDVVTELPRSAAFQRIAAAATLTSGQLEQYYDQARKQARDWSRASMVAASLGFVMVLAGIVVLLAGNTTVGVVTSISGIVPEIAAALFFRQAGEANRRVDAYHRDLLEAQGVHQAIEVCETMEDGDDKERLKETIIANVLGIEEG